MTMLRHRILAQAGQLFDEGRCDEACAAIDRLLENTPTDTMAWLRAGELLDGRDQPGRAVRAYLQAADLFARGGDSLRAVALLRRAERLDDSRPDTSVRLARLCREMGMADEAAAAYRKAAGILLQSYQVDDYLQVAEEALAHRPDDTDLLNEMVLVYFQQGDTRRALARLKRSVALDHQNPATLTLLGDALLYARRPDMAARCFKEQARVHCHAGDQEAMRTALERIAEIRREHPHACLQLGPYPPGANRADLGPMIRAAFLKRSGRAGAGGPPPAGMDTPAPDADSIDLELALVDYFLGRGMHEEATDILEELANRHGHRPQIARRLEQCASICSQGR